MYFTQTIILNKASLSCIVRRLMCWTGLQILASLWNQNFSALKSTLRCLQQIHHGITQQFSLPLQCQLHQPSYPIITRMRKWQVGQAGHMLINEELINNFVCTINEVAQESSDTFHSLMVSTFHFCAPMHTKWNKKDRLQCERGRHENSCNNITRTITFGLTFVAIDLWKS